MTTINIDRVAFEAWARKKGLDVATRVPDAWGRPEYLRDIDAMWFGWQAALQSQATAEPVIPAGFALVPIRMTRAMEEVFEEEGWEWANVLAAAEAVTEEEYEAALEGVPPATQAALTAALEALKAMQSYAAAEHKGLKICDDAIAQLEAVGVK